MKSTEKTGEILSLAIVSLSALLWLGCTSLRRSPVIVTPPPAGPKAPEPTDCKEELGQRWDGEKCQTIGLPTPQTAMTYAECLAAKFNWTGGKCVKPSVSTPDNPTPTDSTPAQPIASQCNVKNLKICLVYGQSGEDCFAKNLCQQGTDNVTYSCNLQALNICLSYQGGKACYLKHDCDPKQ